MALSKRKKKKRKKIDRVLTLHLCANFLHNPHNLVSWSERQGHTGSHAHLAAISQVEMADGTRTMRQTKTQTRKKRKK